MTEPRPRYIVVRRCRCCNRRLPPIQSGKWVNPKRRYCSSRCRQAVYRARKKALKDALR